MQRFKKILFVREQNTTATSTPRRAVQLARNNKAQLTICDASKELPKTPPKLNDTFRQIHESQLLARFEGIDLAGIKTRTKLLTGTPFIEIIKEVQRGDHDLVIKSAEGSGGTFSNLFGETDMSLMRKCPCPVWIVKPSSRTNYARIVAAVDPDPAVKENAALNRSILNLASSLARQENSELHVVHAWALQGEDMYRSARTGLTKLAVDEMAVDVQETHKKWLNELLEHHNFNGIDLKIHLEKGDAGKVIPALIEDKQADIVVMGTVARTGIEGFFIGNTAEKILRNVDCSVLTVKPQGFKTPIKA